MKVEQKTMFYTLGRIYVVVKWEYQVKFSIYLYSVVKKLKNFFNMKLQPQSIHKPYDLESIAIQSDHNNHTFYY